MGAKEKIFFFVKNVIEEEKSSSFFKLLVKKALTPLSFPLCLFIFLKNFLYDKRILSTSKVAAKVVSIGNIVAGGTNKTPFVIYLAEKLVAKGLKVAIVSRGYGAKKRKKGEVLTFSPKQGLKCDPIFMGDEPCLISRRIREVDIFVGRDKILCARAASSTGADIILLDDGFQSRKLFRDLDIVLVDSTSPISNGQFLPRGLLRDSLSSLKRADIIIMTNAQLGENQKFLSRLKADIPIIFSALSLSGFRDLSQKIVDLPTGKIGAFCAIANPKRFYHMLKERGFELVEKISFFDHSRLDEYVLRSFSLKAKEYGAGALICTEKDMVKLPQNLRLSLPVYYASMDYKIITGEKKLEEVVQIIC